MHSSREGTHRFSFFLQSAMRERAFLAAWLLLLLVGTARSSKDAVLVGLGECSDCLENKIRPAHAFTGLSVTVDCKNEKGELITKAKAQFDSEGKFNVQLPKEVLSEKGSLNQDCYARILSSSNEACPSAGGLEASKIVYKALENGKRTFVTKGKLSFSPLICTSATFWCQHPWFKDHPWCQNKPPLPFPPISFPPKPFFPPKFSFPSPPSYEPPPTPVYTPPTPVYTPPAPVYTPPTPVYNPPVYVKPPTPVYKPPVYTPPVYVKPPTPVYKPPVYVKPPTPVYKPPTPVYKPPVYVPPVIPKQPCPPIFNKPLPPIPKIVVPQYPPYGGSPPHYAEKKSANKN